MRSSSQNSLFNRLRKNSFVVIFGVDFFATLDTEWREFSEKNGQEMSVEILNVAYDTDTTRREWIENISNLYAQYLPYPGCQRAGLAYTINDAGELELPDGFHSPDNMSDERVMGILGAFNAVLDQQDVKNLFNAITCASFSQRLGELKAKHLINLTASFGAQDSITVASCNFDGTGFMFSSFHDKFVRVSKVHRREWMYVAAHVAAITRIRMAHEPADYFALAEWIYDKKTGRVIDAKSEAKDKEVSGRLIQATKTLDRNRVDKDETVITKWQALTEGRWTLLDVIDGPQNYVVAMPNDPPVREAVAMTTKQSQVLWFLLQGHSQAFVAYELGISPIAVSRLLTALRKKFGVKTTVELLRLTRGVLPQTPIPPALTDAQKDLMEGIANGFSDSEIAKRRNRSVKTVRNQIQTIYRLLGVNSRAELVAKFAF